jgi:hypothetical protein
MKLLILNNYIKFKVIYLQLKFYFMKKYYFLLFTLFLLIKVNGQIIDFKDTNFKAKLLEASITNETAKDLQGNFCKIDLNNDNEIQITEAENISWLNIRYSYITDLLGISEFSNLEYLNCDINDTFITDLIPLKKLKTLLCGGNTKLDGFDFNQLNNIESLYCEQSNLTSIDLSRLKDLKFLYLSSNLLNELDLSGLTNLKIVNCSNNYKLKSINLKGLKNLEKLDCSNGGTEFKYLYNLSDCAKLNELSCENNSIEDLNIQKNLNLVTLSSRNNHFSSLNLSGLLKLKYVEAGSKYLTSIELNGKSNIETLLLDFSNLVTLDLSNCTKLTTVFCNSNELLTTIFCKNGSVEWLALNRCFSLKYICCDEEQFKAVDDEIKNNQLVGVNYNTYCSFTPGGVYSIIDGNSKLDINNNGYDENDIVYPGLNFNLTNGTDNGNFVSDVSGHYNVPVGYGKYTITPFPENPTYYNFLPEFGTVIFSEGSINSISQNFSITPNGSHKDLETTILPLIPARPGFDATYKIIFKNKGNQVQSGTVTLDFNDAVLDYVSSVPQIKSQITNKLSWDYIDLKPFETREITLILNVNSPMETPAVNIGDRLSFNVLITPVTDDEKPVDNSFALRQSVVGSFDPNDKTCLEGDVITSSLIGEYVHYLIRFENTGTYPAENIVVKDMIDLSKFDISTLMPTKASHSYVTKISDGNKVEFIFEKINLPFDDANNDGYIAFKIKTLPTLSVGDSFENEANIYFDYNFPILTNKAVSSFKTLGTQDFEFSKYVKIHPVPANDVLNINLQNTIEIKTISIYDILGHLIITIPNAQTVSNIDVSKLKTGNYFLRITSNKGISSIKFIKK